MKIFILGAVTGTTKNDQEKLKVYVNTLKSLRPLDTIICPDDIWEYRNKITKNYPTQSENDINAEMVKYDLKMIKSSDIYVCDLSKVSTGMGIELGTILPLIDKKFIYFFAQSGSIISNMVLGAFPKVKVNYYSDITQLQKMLEAQFSIF